MIYNFDESKVFDGPEGIAFIPVATLDDKKVLAVKVSDVNGGADIVNVYLVEKPA